MLNGRFAGVGSNRLQRLWYVIGRCPADVPDCFWDFVYQSAAKLAKAGENAIAIEKTCGSLGENCSPMVEKLLALEWKN